MMCSTRFMLKRNKPDNSCPSSARLSEEVMADDRDDYEFLVQASIVRGYTHLIKLMKHLHAYLIMPAPHSKRAS